jgi:hypothetical protein
VVNRAVLGNRADEVTGQSWQLITAIHDEGGCLILSASHKVHTLIVVMLVLVFAGLTKQVPSMHC